MRRTIAIILAVITVYLLFFVAGMDAEARAVDEKEEICPYRFLILTPEDEALIACCLEAECSTGYTTYECKVATCQVILNRILSERFGGEYHSAQKVICGSQFTTYPYLLYVEPTEETWQCLDNTLMGEDLQIPYYVCFFSQGLNAGTTFYSKIGGHTFAYRESDKNYIMDIGEMYK